MGISQRREIIEIVDGDSMIIREIKHRKRDYLPLLLLADEQESMIDHYLDRGQLYVLEDPDLRAVCVLTDEGDNILEIKNLAVDTPFQGRGYGKAMIEFVVEKYRQTYSILQVGTGESTLTLPFYQKCGFSPHHRLKNFFIENYEQPIIEAGQLLKDMIYLRRDI